MCGVAGVFAYSPAAAAVDRAELRAVRDHMAARGPDGTGEWFSADGRVGLGHRRLSIIDLSERGAQPMASGDGRLVISFNGEIYNYRELRAELRARGRVFTTESDTEVILQLYDEYGTAMLARLRGMFALALWDERKRGMLLARDAFGLKPMYYADDGKTLRCASQVKALLRARVDTSPEPAGHAGFFLWGSVPGPWTLYRGIRSLEPGHWLWIGESGAQPPQPYSLVSDVLAAGAQAPAHGTAAQALEHVSAALRDSVVAHLVSDVPVGIFLSAGMDSSMLSALVRSTGVQPMTLTLGFAEYAGTPQDELPLAQEIAALHGTRHASMTVRRADFEAESEKMLAAMDQPSIDGVNTWFVARAAAANGLKVALSGLGGDELFGSYPSFREVPFLKRIAAPLAAVPGLGLLARRLSEPLLRRWTSPKYAGLIEYGATLGGAYLLRRGLFMPWELPRVMDPQMAQAGWERLQTLPRLQRTTDAIIGRSRERLAISALEMSWYMRNQLLNDADWAGMAHGVEIRVPFVDLPFLRAAVPWVAAHPSLSKRDVARHTSPGLPSALLDKPKTGFTVPVREWLGATAPSTRGLRGWAHHIHDSFAAAAAARPALQAPPARRRVLVSTLAPGNGGVTAMTSFVVRNLAARNLEPVIAHYAPYSVVPGLSVPFFRLLQRRAGSRRGTAFDQREIHAIGAWLPELEFTHYAASRHWRELMDSCEAYVAVSGNVLAATPFRQSGRPYLAWVATDWEGDRRDRVRHFPWIRRLLDSSVNAPVIRRLERQLLRDGHVLSLSEYTARVLGGLAGPSFSTALLPVPVDAGWFVPRREARVRGRTGFAGRFNDPRKNIGLLLHAVARLRAAGHDITCVLMGDTAGPGVRALLARLQLEAHVTVLGGLSRDAMRDAMQSLDVFVLPSHQEGLCISALEAFACGVPVVSTRCGGPEEFVIPGRTGALVDADVEAMAAAILSIVGDDALRERLSRAARALVEERYASAHAEQVFFDGLRAAFPGLCSELAAPARTGTPRAAEGMPTPHTAIAQPMQESA